MSPREQTPPSAATASTPTSDFSETKPTTDSESDQPFPITGAIPRVERQQSHYEFLWTVRPPAAMTNLIHARRMLMHGETADSFFPPETTVLVTSTIPDDDLAGFTFEDEIRLIRAFRPNYYLPFDFPVYGDMSAERRRTHVKQVAGGTLDMARILGPLTSDEVDQIVRATGLSRETVRGELETSIIPLIKGTTPDERAVMEQTVLDVGAPIMAKYASQYMTVPGGGNYPALRADLEAIEQETAGYPLLVVGLLSPTGKYSLEGVPENVVAAAGGAHRWKARVQPDSNTPDEMREAYYELAVDVAEALDVPVQYDPAVAGQSRDTPPGESLETAPGAAAVSSENGDIKLGVAGATETPSEYAFGGRKRPKDAPGPRAARAYHDSQAGATETDEASERQTEPSQKS